MPDNNEVEDLINSYNWRALLARTPEQLTAIIMVVLNIANIILKASNAAEIDSTIVSAVNAGLVVVLTGMYVAPAAMKRVAKKTLEGIALGRALTVDPDLEARMRTFAQPSTPTPPPAIPTKRRRQRPIQVRKD